MWASLMLMIFSISIDAFFAGVAYGGRKIKIPVTSKFVISCFSVLYTSLSIWAGFNISKFVPSGAAKYIGVILLIFMAIYMIYQGLVKKVSSECIEDFRVIDDKKNEEELFKYILKKPGITIKVIKNPTVGDIDNSGKISIIEAFILGFALNIDSIGTGIGSALTGLVNPFLPISTGVAQLLMLCLGELIGMKLSKLFKTNRIVFAILPGLLLIFLAFLRFIP
jgi:putative sporulation protein YtaF